MAKSTAKPMTKSAILEHLAGETELTKRQIAGVMDSLIELAYREAKKGFTVPGLGKLVCSARKARMGRNPQTGEAIKIPARTVLRFRVGKQAKDAILGAKPAAAKGAKAKAKPAAKPAAKKAAAKKR